MYHTEVYLDQKTYFTKGHLWIKTVSHQGDICYLWYIRKREKLEAKDVEAEIDLWIREKLGGSLEKKDFSLQKELNRLAGRLDEGDLHFYYRGQFISCIHNMAKGRVILGCGIGMYISDSMSGIFEEYGMEEVRRRLSEETAECVANLWKGRMLRAMMQRKLKWGYFLLWQEGENAF